MSEIGVNIKKLLDNALKDKPSDWHPVANVLAQIDQLMGNGNYGIARELLRELIMRLNKKELL